MIALRDALRHAARAAALVLGACVLTLLAPAGARAQPNFVDVIEYHNAALDHYFITADPDEIAILDGGAFGGAWRRTGATFPAWPVAAPPAGGQFVCRFAGTDRYRSDGSRIGPNSHFYTNIPEECEFLKTAYQSVAADGVSYPAWTFEGFAFAARYWEDFCEHALFRAYNNGAGGDANHRYSDRSEILLAMPGWTVEGPVMCLPVLPPPVAPVANSGRCLIPVPGLIGEVRNSLAPELTQRVQTLSIGEQVEEAVNMVVDDVVVAASFRRYVVAPQADGETIVALQSQRNELLNVSYTAMDVVGHRLRLPMQVGESQSASATVSGTNTIFPLGCSEAFDGRVDFRYTFTGFEQVTVPAGTFDACRFEFEVANHYHTTCKGGTGGGGSNERLTLWAVEDIGQVKTLSSDGSTTELVSFGR